MADLYKRYGEPEPSAAPKQAPRKPDLFDRYGVEPASEPQPTAQTSDVPQLPQDPQLAAEVGATLQQFGGQMEESEGPSFAEGVKGLGGALAAGAHRTLAGAAQAGEQFVKPALDAALTGRFQPPTQAQRQKQAQAPAQAQEAILEASGARESLSPTQQKVAGFAGEIAPAALLPASRLGSATATGGALGASQFDPEGTTDPKLRAGQALFGAGAGGTLQAASGPLLKGLVGSARAVRQIVKEFDPAFRVGRSTQPIEQEAAGRLSRELGDFVTPGEATGSATSRAREAALRLDEGTREKAFAALRRRDSKVEEHVQEASRRLVPEGREAAAAKEAELFSNANQVETGGHWLSMLRREHPVVDKVTRQRGLAEEGDPFTQGSLQQIAEAEGVQLVPGTVGELDLLRKALGRAEKTAFSRGDKASARALTRARQDVTRTIDAFAPDHAVARSISQRRILQDNLEQALAEGKAGAEVGDTFFDKFLANGKKQKALMDDIDNIVDKEVQGAVKEKIDLLARVLPRIHKSPLADAIRGGNVTSPIGAQGGGTTARSLGFLGEIIQGGQDKALVEFITSPRWTRAQLAKAVTAKEPNRAAEQLGRFLRGITMRGAAQTAAQQAQPARDRILENEIPTLEQQ